MSRISSSFATAALAALVAAPALAAATLAADPPVEPTPHPPAALAGTSLMWCGDVVTPRADPSLYKDEPVYRGNSMPAHEVERWARSKPGFVDVWIDREHNGWVNAMFTQDVERRQAELARAFPGEGVVAVAVDNSKRELRRLAKRVGEFVQERDLQASWGWGNADNIVELGLSVVTDELAEALDAAFAGEPLCVGGADPEELVPPGPQPLAGDGWTMVAWEQGDGPAHEVGLATDEATYAVLWPKTGLEGPAPAVDFLTDVVAWFAIGHGSSCPNLRLDEVIVDRERAQVYPLIVDPDNPIGCTDDLAGAYQFVTAIERSALPGGPFDIGLDGGGGQLWRSLHVGADLSVPGAVAGPGDVSEPRD